MFAVCIEDPAARRVACLGLAQEGQGSVSLPLSRLVATIAQASEIDGVVYDLAPWDLSARRTIQAIRDQAVLWPVILYPPCRPGIESVITSETARFPAVVTKLQFHDGAELQRLREIVRSVISETPVRQLTALVRALVPDLPPAYRDLPGLVFRTLSRRSLSGGPVVGTLAAELGVSTRSLERTADLHGLPRPKEMVSLLTLLFVAFCETKGVVSTTRSLGISAQQLYRLRRRFRPLALGGTAKHSRDEFNVWLLALLERCSPSTSQATAVQGAVVDGKETVPVGVGGHPRPTSVRTDVHAPAQPASIAREGKLSPPRVAS